MVKSEPVTPLGRPKATKSLGGMVEPEPLPRLLIWHICHESFGDLADLNHCHSYWGPWSCPTMVIPSEQLSIAYFCKWFLSLLLLPCCFHGLFVSLLLLDFSYVNKHIFSGSTINYKLTEHGQVLIWRPSARFDFLLPSYYGVNRCLLQPGTVYHQPAQYERSYHYSRLGSLPLLQDIGKPMMWFNVTGMIYFIDYS